MAEGNAHDQTTDGYRLCFCTFSLALFRSSVENIPSFLMAFRLKGCALGAGFFFSIVGYSGLRIQGMFCTTSCDFAALRQSGQFFSIFLRWRWSVVVVKLLYIFLEFTTGCIYPNEQESGSALSRLNTTCLLYANSMLMMPNLEL